MEKIINRRNVVLIFIFLINITLLFSQNDTLSLDEIRNKAIKVFIDCRICDLDY